MKAKLILALFGIALGALLILPLLPLLREAAFRLKNGAGSQFESLDDLRAQMLSRDSRDITSDRSVSLRSIISPHPSDRIIYDLTPNNKVKFQGVPVEINSCGMRGPERSIKKPASTFRIALLGDSFAFGWGVEQPKIFAQVLEDLLNQFTNGSPKIEILNFGTPGYSTFQEVALFEEKIADFDPDSVLLYVVDNDFALPFYVPSVNSSSGLIDSLSFSKLTGSGKDQKANEAKRALEKLSDPNRALSNLRKITRETGSKLFVAINPNQRSGYVRSHLWASKDPEIEYIPMRREIHKLIKSRNIDPHDLPLPNDPHPSALKHRLLAEILAKYMMASTVEILAEDRANH